MHWPWNSADGWNPSVRPAVSPLSADWADWPLVGKMPIYYILCQHYILQQAFPDFPYSFTYPQLIEGTHELVYTFPHHLNFTV
jgi:hypothetical protein